MLSMNNKWYTFYNIFDYMDFCFKHKLTKDNSISEEIINPNTGEIGRKVKKI